MDKKLENLTVEELVTLRRDLDEETFRRQAYVKLTISKLAPASALRSRFKAHQMYLQVVRHPDHRMPSAKFVRLLESDRLSPWPLTPDLAITLAKLDAKWGLEWKLLSSEEVEVEWARLRELSYSEPNDSK